MNCLGSSCIFLPKEPKYRLYDRWVRSKSPQCFALINISFGTKFFGYRELAGVATMIKYSARVEIWLRATLEGASESAQSLVAAAHRAFCTLAESGQWGEMESSVLSQRARSVRISIYMESQEASAPLTHLHTGMRAQPKHNPQLTDCLCAHFACWEAMSVLPPRLLLTNTSENTTNNTPPLS